MNLAPSLGLQEPYVFGWSEVGIFLLANAIIWAICFPRVWADIRKWRESRRTAA
jgi:hypothetical protein